MRAAKSSICLTPMRLSLRAWITSVGAAKSAT
jgi:hypothetical protein